VTTSLRVRVIMGRPQRGKGGMSTQPSLDADQRSDAELIALVRGGDLDAYGELFERHRDSALRLARQLTSAGDADDLVSDAFSSVLRVLMGGGGPDVAFRPYLLTSVRRRYIDSIRARHRVRATDDLNKLDHGQPYTDPAVDAFENTAAANAFRSLPERWQMVLWQMEVEGQKPAEIAVLLGTSANSVSALAYRAREGLKQAYLQNHLADIADSECNWVTERLGAYVRKGLARRESTKVDEHLDKCDKCSALYLELSDVNSNLRGLIAPIILGGAAATYLAAIPVAGATSAAVSLIGRLRHFARSHLAATTGIAAMALAVVAVGAFALQGGPRRTAADDRGAVTNINAGSGTAGLNSPTAGPNAKHHRPATPGAPAALVPPSPYVPTLPIPFRVTPIPLSPTPTAAGTGSPSRKPKPTPPESTSTTVPAPPPPPPPPPPTVSISLKDDKPTFPLLGPPLWQLTGRLDVTVFTGKSAPALTVELSASGAFAKSDIEKGWACNLPISEDDENTMACTITSSSPPPLIFTVVQPNPDFWYAATLSSPDAPDDDPGDNTVKYSGSAS
jgi:RNA polymerase sigma factor (sigma-70 family)